MFMSPHFLRRMPVNIVLLIAIVFSPVVVKAQNSLLNLLTDELKHEMRILQAEETPPYFISYMVSDVFNTSVSASFGVLTNSDESRNRYLAVDVRIGDYQLDNTHELRGQYSFRGNRYIPIAQVDNPDAIRTALWQETNREYRQAVERFAKVKANIAVKIAEEDTSADFSQETKLANFYEPPINIETLIGDRSLWEDKVKKYTSPFLENKDIYGGTATFSFTLESKNFISSEGTTLTQNLIYSRLFVSGFIKSEDGMELPLYRSYFAFKPSDLPDDEEILEDVRTMIKKLETLSNAPVVDPYTGPTILSGRAAGVFFHEIFGHRVEGHRQKSETEGQTLKKKLGERILPEHMSVVFDPTRKKFNGSDLVGYYQYDDEGIRGRKVSVIESGILKAFLMSRSPIENFPNSNGHGRAQAGNRPVSRQSNLLVETKTPVSEDELRRKLIEECKKIGKPFGLLFMDIQGGFTFTGRYLPNVFNINPTEVYRVYTDGRPDELVRGVDLVGTPLVMFSMISDASDKYEVFNGMCGAESGSIPVSTVSPSVFVTQVEVQKKSKSQERPPILPRPDFNP